MTRCFDRLTVFVYLIYIQSVMCGRLIYHRCRLCPFISEIDHRACHPVQFSVIKYSDSRDLQCCFLRCFDGAGWVTGRKSGP